MRAKTFGYPSYAAAYEAAVGPVWRVVVHCSEMAAQGDAPVEFHADYPVTLRARSEEEAHERALMTIAKRGQPLGLIMTLHVKSAAR